ncbi:MAG: CHAT domain-containing tetratricopeptide repeat protein [Thermoanaerobaculia bacterium]
MAAANLARTAGVAARYVVLVVGCSALFGSGAAAQTLDEARALHVAGRYLEALTAYREVAEKTAEDDPAPAAAARHNACFLLLFNLPDYPAALSECEQALRLRRLADDDRGLARTLNILGLALQRLGSYDDAEERLLESLEINRRRDDVEAQVINLSNLGALATAAGRFTAAIRFHTAAVELARRHAAEPWAPERILVDRINYGVVLEKVGAYREALALYEEVLTEAGALDRGRLAVLQVNRGVMYRNLGDPVQAVAAFAAAVTTFEELGDLTGQSNAWLNLGLARHLNLERPEEAEDAFRRALALARESGDRFEETRDLFHLGRLLLEQERLDEAEEAFEQCLQVAAVSESTEGRWSAREGLGRVAEARGQPTVALKHLLQAIDSVEKVRADLERERRGGYFGDKRSVYAAAVRILAELEHREPGTGHAGRALELVQRAKARELLDVLGDHGGGPLPVAELRRLAGDRPVLELFLGEERLYAWVIRGTGVRMVDLGPSAPVIAHAAAVHRALAAGEKPSPADLAALSAKLLKETGVTAAASAKLWIAPDGRLDHLPFELLEDGGESLVDRRAVSYLPSASALGWLRGGSREPVVGVAGFGDPILSRRTTEFATPTDLLVDRFDLGPLPAAAGELASAAARLPGEDDIHLGGDATEEAFRRAAAAGSRVLHLATHSVIDDRPGRGAAILLTADGDDDGVLYPEEIAALDLHTRLTVLASCRSALGSGESGRALASLTGAFLAAGSPAVIATLWDVDDAATAVFMDQLYFHLAKGRTPAEALRRTKQRLRSDPRWARPELWAGYVLIGDAPAVVSRHLPLWIWGLLGLAALLSAVWMWRRRRLRG